MESKRKKLTGPPLQRSGTGLGPLHYREPRDYFRARRQHLKAKGRYVPGKVTVEISQPAVWKQLDREAYKRRCTRAHLLRVALEEFLRREARKRGGR